MEIRKRTGQPAYVVPNPLARDFSATQPLERLLTDGFTQDTAFVPDTLNQLPDLPKGCILQSDQGSVYTSYAYQQAVKEKGIIMSMSRKGTPADSSPIEMFYLDNNYRTTNSRVIQIVEEYIDYYNNIRIKTKLNNQSPVQFRQLAV